MIVGFSGYLRSGKDTAAQALIEDGFEHRSFAKALKDMAYNLNPIVEVRGVTPPLRLAGLVDAIGWERAKDNYPEIRALLQRMGTDAGRKVLGEDIWVDTAMRGVERTGHNVVFTDVRFPNEADAIRDHGGMVIRVLRLGGFDPTGQRIAPHPSETALDGYDFDAWIYNNSTVEDLHRTVRKVVGNFLGDAA